MRSSVLIIGAALVSVASASESDWRLPTPHTPSYFFNVYGGQSMTILGSEDRRTGFGIGIGYGRREPKFRIRGLRSELVYEGYYEQSSSRGASGQSPNDAESVGLLVYARYRWPKRRGAGIYATAGWGLQYTNKKSVDLDSKINSTPILGLGVSWDSPDGEGSVGLRFIHISNAGLVGNNQGQNQLFLVYSWRF